MLGSGLGNVKKKRIADGYASRQAGMCVCMYVRLGNGAVFREGRKGEGN